MPELPEVETIVRRFRPLLEGRRIARFVSRWKKQAEPSVAAVRRGIVGKEIARLWRRAKFIVADLNGRRGPSSAERSNSGHLLVHLRMSGRLAWAADFDGEPPHVRTVFELDDGNTLWFCDARKFGKVIYTTDFERTTTHLGLEPLEHSFTTATLESVLRGRARQLKPLLLDQSLVSGLGNIYADEVLFEARLHPLTRADGLTRDRIAALRNSIRAVLRKGIRHNGTSIDWIYPDGGMERHLKVYGRAGRPCKRCRTPIATLRVAQRGTHICPKCQRIDGGR